MNFLRKHWKKFAVASIPAYYVIDEAKKYYSLTIHMQTLCTQIAACRLTDPPNNILVVLNPMANKKRCEKLFSKYCEPILHLSGDFIKIVRTEHVGHAKTLIESLERLPDVIVVAGGDGTSSEVVTGLLRRNDVPCPLVLLPLGECSKTALQCLNYSPSTKIEQLKALSNSLLPLLHRRLKNQNVMQFNIIARNEKEDDDLIIHKPIYALRQFSWGLLKGIEEQRSKYWYLGFFKHYASVIANTFSDRTQWTVLAKLIFPPRNCVNCVEMNQKKTWFKVNRTNVFCDECEKEKIQDLEANQIDIICNEIKNNSTQLNIEELQGNFIKSLPKGIGFLENLFNVVQHKLKPTEVIKMPSVQLVPAVSSSDSTVYYIDGEEYDALPVKISMKPNAIRIFC